ncbi:MAG TPA: hypothetical protein VF228_26365 [Iamia sp.]
MTDDRTLTAVDERARAAAAGVRAAVAERPVPLFDPDLVRIDIDARPDRRRRTLVGLVAAAAAVLVVVAAVVSLAGTGDDDSAPAVAPGDLPRYVLRTAPEGFALAVVHEAGGDSSDLAGPATVYGPAADRAALAVAPLPVDPEDESASESDVPLQAQDLPEVEVPGRRAWDASEGIGEGALFVEVGDRLVVVLGAGAGEATVAAAAAVTLDGEVASVPGDALPEDWSRLGDVPLLDALGSLALSGGPEAGGRAWGVSYGPLDGGDTVEIVAVGVDAGGPLDVGLSGLLTSDVEEVEVRGGPAVLARLHVEAPGGTTTWWTLRWEDRPGVVVEIVAASDDRFGRDDVLALAEDLVALAPDDLPALRHEADRYGLDAPGVVVLGEGQFSDGSTWTLASEPGGETDISLTLRTSSPATGGTSMASAGSASADGDAGAPVTPFPGGVTVEEGEDLDWAYGEVRAEVATVEVRRPGGDVLGTGPTVSAEGITGFVVELPVGTVTIDGISGSPGVTFVALDAAGAEVGRAEF